MELPECGFARARASDGSRASSFYLLQEQVHDASVRVDVAEEARRHPGALEPLVCSRLLFHAGQLPLERGDLGDHRVERGEMAWEARMRDGFGSYRRRLFGLLQLQAANPGMMPLTLTPASGRFKMEVFRSPLVFFREMWATVHPSSL